MFSIYSNHIFIPKGEDAPRVNATPFIPWRHRWSICKVTFYLNTLKYESAEFQAARRRRSSKCRAGARCAGGRRRLRRGMIGRPLYLPQTPMTNDSILDSLVPRMIRKYPSSPQPLPHELTHSCNTHLAFSD